MKKLDPIRYDTRKQPENLVSLGQTLKICKILKRNCAPYISAILYNNIPTTTYDVMVEHVFQF